MGPKEVMNRLKWTSPETLKDVTIWYVHRGAPDGVRAVKGSDVDIGRSYLELERSSIPYHRITKICMKEEVLYERRR